MIVLSIVCFPTCASFTVNLLLSFLVLPGGDDELAVGMHDDAAVPAAAAAAAAAADADDDDDVDVDDYNCNSYRHNTAPVVLERRHVLSQACQGAQPCCVASTRCCLHHHCICSTPKRSLSALVPSPSPATTQR